LIVSVASRYYSECILGNVAGEFVAAAEGCWSVPDRSAVRQSAVRR